MKTKYFLIAFLALICLALVGCNKSDTTTRKAGNKTEALDEYWDANQNGIYDFDEGEKVNLTYATWQWHEGETTIDTLLIQAFEAEHPNVNVDMVYIGESYEWDENLFTYAESGELPDVFLVNRLEDYLPLNMLADITECYDHDADAEYIFDSLQSSGVYNGVRYAVPTFIYASWWFVNLDILESNGIDAPGYDWTWDQMEAIAQACYNETTHTFGQSGYTQYWQVLPKVISSESSWSSFTYDGTKFNFDSQSFETAMSMLEAGLKNHSVSSPLTIDQVYEYYNKTITEFDVTTAGYNVGYDGYSAIWVAPSWQAKDYFNNMLFEWDVYPAPGGTVGGNTDIIGISSTCKNVQAAYQLMKWMSYGQEGLTTRYEFYESEGENLYISANNYPYPVANYGLNAEGENEIWDNIPYDDVPGMTSSAMISALRNGAFVLNKETPGWDDADAAVNPYLYQIGNGEQTWAGVKTTAIEACNNAFKEFNDTLKAQLEELKK